MLDWVRVIDADNNVIYMNKAMSEGLGLSASEKKCYEMIGHIKPCENCISRKSTFSGIPCEKEEFINGRVFSIMSSPIRNADGKIIAAVEVLRDITSIRKLYQEMHAQNQILRDEIEMARRLQVSLLPEPPEDHRMDFSLIFMPCKTLGGDFVDIFHIDDSHIGLYIADVSGHGVPASLLTVFLHSTMNKELLSPAKALEELYHEFNRSRLDKDMYIAIFYTIIDLDSKTMLYSNAGLNAAPVVYSDTRFNLLRLPGIPISNWSKKPEYCDSSIKLQPGDKLFMYTDGILEMKNETNEQYGEERLLDILLKSDLKPKQLLMQIKKSAFQFSGIKSVNELQDDVTIALLEIR